MDEVVVVVAVLIAIKVLLVVANVTIFLTDLIVSSYASFYDTKRWYQ